MSQPQYSYREAIRELRIRIETSDPMYYGLKKLKLRGKDLIHLNYALFKLTELEVLDLSPDREACLFYKLPSIPPSIGKLVNLKVLILDTNELDEVPREIVLLLNLERLALSNNNIASLPVEFGRLKKMRSLHLAKNELDHFPASVCSMENLEFLDLSDNKISDLPHEIGDLINLHSLLLWNNRIVQLPDTICRLTSLTCLWLGNNKLTRLPLHFGNLINLEWGWSYTSSIFDRNPLQHPPLEICRLGPHAIDQYFSASSGEKVVNGTATSSRSRLESDKCRQEVEFDAVNGNVDEDYM